MMVWLSRADKVLCTCVVVDTITDAQVIKETLKHKQEFIDDMIASADRRLYEENHGITNDWD
jgi:hypothetical protein